MYNLGDIFNFDLNLSRPNPSSVIKGNKYRITVLTDGLLRLEYSESGRFEDYPTELVWYRNLDKPHFTFQENEQAIKITTKYLELIYMKEKPFLGSKLSPSSNLKITLKDTLNYWYYGHPEVRNYSSTSYNIRGEKSKIVQKSLYSTEGFCSIDDSNSDIILENGSIQKRVNKEIDIYVFMYNKDFYKCLTDYFKITGYPSLIPRYALGNWWSKNKIYNEVDLIKLTKKFEENNIPLSTITLNKWNVPGTYLFNGIYKDVTSLVNFLHSKNIKVGLSLDELDDFSDKNHHYNTLSQYLPSFNGVIPFNLYDTKTVDAYLKLIIHPLDNYGFDFYNLKTFNLKNIKKLSLLKYYHTKDKSRYSKRALLIGKNSMMASHRYSVLYSGESTVSWESLKNIPSFNSSASNIAVSWWAHDIGGFYNGVEDNELFTRFVQLGVFSPILKLDSDDGKYYKREPWKWGVKTLNIVREYLNLRHRLIPYIYTEAYKYYKYGKPLIEPIYYRYPEFYDSPIYCNDYFFGSNIFVSPITEKKDYVMNRVIHKFFIPKGIWYDYFTGKKYVGNKKYVSFYKDEDYPVFIQAGSIIPLSNNLGNSTSVPTNMEIMIMPGGSNTYSIYEDDGESNSYIRGDYLITNVEFRYSKDKYNLVILPVEGKSTSIPSYRNYKIRFRNTKQVSKVMTYISSSPISNINYSKGTDFIVEVSKVPTNTQFTVCLTGDNIEIDAIRIINEDIVSIISDLPIKTSVKVEIDKVIFNENYDISKKRIEIRKLSRRGLDKKYVQLFLKLLEYIKEV